MPSQTTRSSEESVRATPSSSRSSCADTTSASTAWPARSCRNDHEAEEVTQEAWVRAYEHLDQFDGRAAFPTWLGRIASARGLGPRAPGEAPVADRAGRGRRGPRDDVRVGEPGPETEAMGQEVRSLLEAAVEALPESYRTVFVLRHVEELSTAETAELLDLTEEAVKTRLHRARAALQETLLAKAGGELPLAFAFLGNRCDRMVASVLLRIAGGAAEPN